jgi:hypothetical protein
MAKQLKTYRPSGGHILDIDPAEIADQFLTLAKNVNTRKGFPSRRGGRRIAYPVSSGHAPNDPYHLLNLNLNSFNWWMLFGTNNIFAVETTNSYDITFAGMQTIADPSQWSSTLLNGIPVFSNGKDGLLYWAGNGAVRALALPAFPVATSVGYVVAFRFHLFGLNVDGPGGIFDNQIIWSDATDPGALPATWAPGPNNEAGSAILADTPGRCIAGLPLGAQLMIYKPESVYPVVYAGQLPDNIFTVGAPNRSLGVLGPHCVKDLGDKHLVVGGQDVALYDGVNFRSIAEDRVKRAIFNSIDETYAANSFVVRDLNKREVWVCTPETGSRFATIAHIWDERRDTWAVLDLTAVRYGTTGYVTDTSLSSTWDSDAAAWDTDTTAWNESSTGAITHVVVSQINTLYVEDTSDAVSVTATITKLDMSFGDDSQYKIVNGVWIRGTGLGLANIQFRLGSRDDTNSSITWQSFQPANADGSLTIPEISGRYISIEITATSVDVWTINRLIFDWKYNGAY